MVQGSFVTIKDITVKDCWGDCICIGKSSSQNIDIDHITIDNCKLDNSRRQGISVTHGSNIIIRSCNISNISGHKPQAAIDIEPNDGNYAKNITIENCTVKDCIVGIVVYSNSNYEKEAITISNCAINCTVRAIALNGINTPVTVSNNRIETLYNAISCNTVDGK